MHSARNQRVLPTILLNAGAAMIAFASLLGAPAAAQDIDADAAKAFAEMIESYRERPALHVKTKVAIELTQGDMTSNGDEVEAEFLFGKSKTAMISLRGFQCLLADGEMVGVHTDNEHSYYRTPDDDSPYYALFNAFIDIPFPHLAIFIGEDAMEDLYMQIHPIAPMIVPRSVSDIRIDGKVKRVLTMSSDDATLELLIDPETKLIASAELSVTGGALVQPGVTMRYLHEFEYETFDEPLPADRFAIDIKGRQRVTMLATLQPPPPPPAPMDPGAAPGMPGKAALVGQPAPEFTLETLAGDAVDLGELRGQVVVIDFWATWCPPCVKGLPLLHDVAKWARDEQLPVKVFAINTFEGSSMRNDSPDARRTKAGDFWNAKKFTLPVLMDYTDQVAASYAVTGIPTTVVIRADGVVHTARSGLGPDFVQQLKSDIQAAMDAVESDTP